MLASVVIACYNHARYIPACLESIYRQSYEDIELVIIDDASTDTSFDILKLLTRQDSFRQRFKGVRVERNPINLGAAATWNRAIERARGDLIFLLNSDDLFEENRVSDFVRSSRPDPYYFGLSFVRPIDDNNVSLENSSAIDFKYRPRRLARRMPELEWGFLEYNLAITTGNFVFNRRLFETIGGFTPLRYCHDWSFALRAVTCTRPQLVEKQSYAYRIHATNSFRGLTAQADTETASCFEDYASFALSQRPLNRACLSPFNQGPAFGRLLAYVPAFRYWTRSHYAPYSALHRTVRDGPYTRYPQASLPF